VNWGEQYGGSNHLGWDDAVSWITIVALVLVLLGTALWAFL
tara:strand:+ start:248 stop:370 length:123 start_codon:yes stop_codon:yes gene_type:complete